MKKSTLFALLVLFVVLDLGYTFVQAYQLPLEGDLPSIVLPAPECRQVLTDPFGWAALTRNEVYVAPNRFFAHASMVTYFKSVPFVLQRITTPINSIYGACALFAVLVQALLLYVLGVYISGSYRLRQLNIWVAIVLVLPLFQLSGFNDQMGIIDPAITYTFFYAFPMTLLLLLLLPFYQAAYSGQPLRVTWPGRIALFGLMVVLAFNGAIITGVVAVLFFGIALHWIIQRWQSGAGLMLSQRLHRLVQVPILPVVMLGLFTVLCLYSLYIGLSEKESTEHVLPIWERYKRLPSGVSWLFRKPGLPVLIAAAFINVQLIRRLIDPSPERQRVLRIFGWLSLFALIYILLLPLGGYRQYRPLIVRRDSVLPIILGLIFFYGMSSYFLLHKLPVLLRRRYLIWVALFSCFYLVTDTLFLKGNNLCERQGLESLAQSTESIPRISAECTVMSWWMMNKPEYTETNAELLQYWGITKNKKLYYQEGW